MKRSTLVVFLAALASVAFGQGTLEKRVGKPLPKLKTVSTKGERITNASLKGKVVILDFWATWCGPCKLAAPTMQRLHTKYASKGLRVIGSDMGEGRKGTAAPYAKKHGYTYTFTENNDKLASDLGIEPIPAFVMIDKKGVVRKVWVGFPVNGGPAALYGVLEKALIPLLAQ